MTPAPAVRAFIAETAVLYQRAIKKLLRRPVSLYFSLVQPAVWLLLFGQAFNRVTAFPGAEAAFGGISYFQFFMPAVILQTTLFGSAQSGIAIISDIDSGFLDKLLTTPIHRLAILLGRVLGDLTRITVQGAIIVLIAWIAGQFQAQPVHYTYGLAGILAALAIVVFFGLGLAGFHVFVALKTRNTESAFLIGNFLTLPLLFTSSALLPRQLLPDWLQRISAVNPVSYAVDSMRFLLYAQPAGPDTEPGSLLLQTAGLLGLIAAITLTLAVRSFRRSVR